MQFINRQKEIASLKQYFEKEPSEILVIYGPKSTGKTTLINHFIEHELDKKKYAVNMLNLRGMLITNFKNFLDRFFPKNLAGKVKDVLGGVTINSGFFGVSVDEEGLLKENPFQVMEMKLVDAKKRGIRPVLILDEIQQLRGIYLNGEQNLLNELFNLFVRLTKEIHTAHIILATSDSYFLDEVHHHAKLAKTALFFRIDQFEKEEVEGWLKQEGFSPEEIETTWQFTGGNPWEIRRVINWKTNEGVLKACEKIVEENMAILNVFTLFELNEPSKRALFFQVASKIAETGRFEIKGIADPELGNLIQDMVGRDMWFYNANEQSVIANSESIRIALQRILQRQSN